MKKITSLLAGALVLLASLAPVAYLAVPAVALTACKTSQTTVAFKSITTLQDAVEASLDGWLRYVYHEKVRIGAIKDRNEQNAALLSIMDREKKAIDSLTAYKASMAIVQVAINEARLKKTDPPPLDLVTTGQSFINLAKAK